MSESNNLVLEGQQNKILSNKKFIASTEQINTIKHAFIILNKVEILNILESNKIKLDLQKLRKKSDLEDFVLFNFKQGNYHEVLFDEIRSEAFNPSLDSTDGFFSMYVGESPKVTKKSLSSFIKEFNEKYEDVDIKLEKYHEDKIKILVLRSKEKLIFDQESMYSVTYSEEVKALCEIYFSKNLIYIQTTNTVIYRAIKSGLKRFLLELFDIEDLKFIAPKMSKNLNFSYDDKYTVAIANKEVHPNTIKLLDILLELQATNSAFSNFECINITFDHEDTIKRRDEKSKVLSQTYGGGDLLYSDLVKTLILNNRIIYQVEFNIIFSYLNNEEKLKKHSVTAGMINDRKGALRIFIKNSDYSLKLVMNKAYQELINVFVGNFDKQNLRNEDEIKKLLGLS